LLSVTGGSLTSKFSFASFSKVVYFLGRKNIPKKHKRKAGYKGTSQYEKTRNGKLLKQYEEIVKRYGKQ